MGNATVYLVIFLFCSILIDGNDANISEQCLRCICHGRSGCYFMKNCANYSISRKYWEDAGRPTVLDDSKDDPVSYENCKKDDNCIMQAMRQYIMPKSKDCDCDGTVDCKDFAAIHYYGDSCRFERFKNVYLFRLDNCLREKGITHTKGWNKACTPDA
ncbi:uncharacterized protein CBL_09540 [Carabus blaptoides fortunei]